ncbi:glutamate--cysteine ligase, partial [Stigmatella erecta]
MNGQELHRLAGEMVAMARRGLQRLDPEDVPLLAPLEQ